MAVNALYKHARAFLPNKAAKICEYPSQIITKSPAAFKIYKICVVCVVNVQPFHAPTCCTSVQMQEVEGMNINGCCERVVKVIRITYYHY